MSILQMQVSDVSGIAKQLDEAALPLIFDNLQKSQYNYPIPSTIRELVCNSVDSIEERKMAVEILSGNRTVQDYYVEREGDIYKDSRFDPSYYDMKWLSRDKDKVFIEYISGGDAGKDTVVVSDYGVGLGGHRLVGYFRLGYSTKRLSTFGIGKYGIGAKAPLAAATFYTIDSYYNGRHYKFNVYSYQVQSIVPPFNMDGTPNPFEMMDMGGGEERKVHYWATDRTNGVSITVEAKKHHKEKYMQAIRNQLLYFDNVEFRVQHENGRIDLIPLTSPILYEDNQIILADNHYAKPHVVIKRVNYGYIDFQELELEDKLGNIGIKLEPEEVDVTPSRESIQWTEYTRETIKRKFDAVVATAQVLVNKEMTETDFLVWIRKCSTLNAVLSRKDSARMDSIVARLAGIVDLSQLTISFAPDPEMKFSLGTFKGVPLRQIKLATVRTSNKDKITVRHEVVKSLSDIAGYPFLLMDQEKPGYTRLRYILENYYPDGFVGFFVKSLGNISASEDMADTENEGVVEEGRSVTIDMLYSPEERERIEKLRRYIGESSEAKLLSSFVVPEGISYRKRKQQEEEEEEEEEEEKEVIKSRREKGDTTFYYLTSLGRLSNNRIYEWNRAVISKEKINQWSNEEVFYGFVNTGEESLLELCALITRRRDDLFFDTIEKVQELRKPGLDNTYCSSNHTLMFNTFTGPTYHKPNHLGVLTDEINEGLKDPRSNLYKYLHDTFGYDEYTEVGGTFQEPGYKILFGVNNTNHDKVRLLRISRSNARFYRNFRHIHYFFRDVRKMNGKNTLTMSNALIRWNTARVIKNMLDQVVFYNNFTHYPELLNRYRFLRTFVDKHYREVSGKVMFNSELSGASDKTVEELTAHCDKIMELQLFVQENPEAGDAVIAKMARGLFGTITTRFGAEVEVQDAWAIDLGLYRDAKLLLSAGLEVATLLNTVPHLNTASKSIPPELYETIQEYLEFKCFESPFNKPECLLPSTETEILSPEPSTESLTQ